MIADRKLEVFIFPHKEGKKMSFTFEPKHNIFFFDFG